MQQFEKNFGLDLSCHTNLFLEREHDLNRTLSCDSGFYESEDSLLMSPSSSCTILSPSDRSACTAQSSSDTASATYFNRDKFPHTPPNTAADLRFSQMMPRNMMKLTELMTEVDTSSSCRLGHVNDFSDVKHEIFSLDFLLETTKVRERVCKTQNPKKFCSALVLLLRGCETRFMLCNAKLLAIFF